MWRHPTFFPLILALLTLTLVAFMVAAFSNRPGTPLVPLEGAVVSEDQYREKIKEALAAFQGNYESASDDLGKLVAAENTLNSILALRVPASEKDFHLQLAFSLNLIREGIKAKSEARKEGEERLEKLRFGTSWLR